VRDIDTYALHGSNIRPLLTTGTCPLFLLLNLYK